MKKNKKNIVIKLIIHALCLIIITTSLILIGKIESTNKDVELKTSNKKLVALTFDDGPSRYTSELVELLDEYNSSATFFVVGSSVKDYPYSLKQAYMAGNDIAIHSYSHSNFTQMTIEEINNEIDETKKIIESLNIKCTNMVRPPFGDITNDIVSKIDASFILWSIDSGDWKLQDKETIKKNIELAIKDGSIILFHDAYENTIETVREILEMYSDEYEFVTVTELFERNQETMQNNQIYYSLNK